jgi:flagellar biogenesis protein FliO
MPRFATILALCAALTGQLPAASIGPTVEQPQAAPIAAEPAARPAESAAVSVASDPAQRTPDSMRPLGKPGPTPVAAPAADSQPASSTDARSMPAWLSQVLALAGVVAVILLVGSLVRRFAPAAGLMGALGPRGRAPSGVLEVLGRYPVSRQGVLVLLKVDRRVLLVSQTTGRAGHRMETLTEITDPAEVASLVAKTADRDAPGRIFERAMDRLGGDARPMPATAPVAPRASAPEAAARPLAKSRAAASEPATLDGSVAARTLRARMATMQAAPSPTAGPVARAAREFTA